MPRSALKIKENRRYRTFERAKIFLRCGPERKSHRSRIEVLRLLEGMPSVLDVGCGNGVMSEMIRERKLALDYLGIASARKRGEKFEKDFYTHSYGLGKFIHHLSTEVVPVPGEIRIRSGRGAGTRGCPGQDAKTSSMR
ncbi:MAG TPA: hypothetical protein VNL14_11235 [Candidatus Acidoferrales bacterium]|nr:hypothetical protein [Candidatus Acidoferrales bacterium]